MSVHIQNDEIKFPMTNRTRSSLSGALNSKLEEEVDSFDWLNPCRRREFHTTHHLPPHFQDTPHLFFVLDDLNPVESDYDQNAMISARVTRLRPSFATQ
jgi:hypothetical protein